LSIDTSVVEVLKEFRSGDRLARDNLDMLHDGDRVRTGINWERLQ